MKTSVLFLLFFLNVLFSTAQNDPDAILGKWITSTNNCMVEVYKQNNEYKAKVIWFKEGKKKMTDYTDEKNPDANLRNRKLLGMDVMHGLHFDTDDKDWVDGKIYDATSGKEWDSVVWLTDDHLLKVKGYWLFKFISETKTFKKV